jgi:two-component system, OmpR family, phosphate regulon sensor histidine kinase PhoR
VALELSVSDGLPLVDLDERAIEIAVINLVDNALKYAPDGQLVSIAVRQQDGKIQIRVADQGSGIPLEDRRRIFERFVRGKTAFGKQVRGSGIGLALVKHIAEAHGGSVWVEDASPHGSLFVLTLSSTPRARPSRPAS